MDTHAQICVRRSVDLAEINAPSRASMDGVATSVRNNVSLALISVDGSVDISDVLDPVVNSATGEGVMSLVKRG